MSECRQANGRHGLVIWIAGMPGSGKSVLADKVCLEVAPELGLTRLVRLDGDRIRQHLAFDLGYERADRLMHALFLVAHSHALAEQGFDVVVSTVSLFDEVYDALRSCSRVRVVFLRTSQNLRSLSRPDLYGSSSFASEARLWTEPKEPDLYLTASSNRDRSRWKERVRDELVRWTNKG